MKTTTALAVAALALAAGVATPAADALADAAYRAFGERGRARDVTRTVDVVMRDTAYDAERIGVRAGETVRFRVRNAGDVVHEFNVGTAAMHADHRREMLGMVESGMLTATTVNTGMDHAAMGHGAPMRHDDPNSVLLEPGKSGEMVFRFTRATTLEFACNVPGHYEAGMRGRLDVTAR